MSQYGNYPPQRTDMRKKKKMNTFLNISIGIVALLIVFIGGSLIFGGDSDESAISNNVEENNSDNNNLDVESNEENESGDISIDSNANSSSNNEENESSESNVSETNNNNEENEENEENNNEENDNEENNNNENNENEEENQELSEPEDGEWAPIGTVQGENFSHDYGEGTVNREEMDQALSYATGLSDAEMTVWQVRNGGNNTVIGTVSKHEDRFEPYKVVLSWVENEGWKPITVEKQSSNPYVSH
ncbi:YrrS family protein [Salipaludibacillus daqingensis]|uniref:YrrS family protein n=1 Tax=Salipaludibacillus daqingensis TaxID=3041001 RepID=UPI0024736B60|nr:YrrS family protein [Salipaludibacillus daqingensis]